MCKTFQTSVREMSELYYSQLRRHNYVTPTSYLELILTFKTLLNLKRDEVDTARNRYIVGLQKLEFATSQVGGKTVKSATTSLKIQSIFFLQPCSHSVCAARGSVCTFVALRAN